MAVRALAAIVLLTGLAHAQIECGGDSGVLCPPADQIGIAPDTNCVNSVSTFKNLFGVVAFDGASYDGCCSFFGGTPALDEGLGWFIVVGLGGVFSLAVSFCMWIGERAVPSRHQDEQHTSEHFASAGRTMSAGLCACDIVSKWTWAATLLQSSNVAWQYGISGPFWYAAGATIQGGLLATFVSSWGHVAVIYIALIIFLWKVYVGPSELGSTDKVWENLQSAAIKFPVPNNFHGTFLTMWSRGGLIFGIINIIGNFGTVFVDQSYWQGAIAARPSATYKGYLLGGIAWFAIPFSMATTLGLASRALDLPLTATEAGAGLVPPAVAVHLLGPGGAFLITFQLFMAVTATGSAEQIAVASLFAYDVWKRYFKPSVTGKELIFISRIMIFVWSILSGVLSVILLELNIGLGWVYLCMGNFIGSAVVPIAFAITWRNCSATGAVAPPAYVADNVDGWTMSDDEFSGNSTTTAMPTACYIATQAPHTPVTPFNNNCQSNNCQCPKYAHEHLSSTESTLAGHDDDEDQQQPAEDCAEEDNIAINEGLAGFMPNISPPPQSIDPTFGIMQILMFIALTAAPLAHSSVSKGLAWMTFCDGPIIPTHSDWGSAVKHAMLFTATWGLLPLTVALAAFITVLATSKSGGNPRRDALTPTESERHTRAKPLTTPRPHTSRHPAPRCIALAISTLVLFAILYNASAEPIATPKDFNSRGVGLLATRASSAITASLDFIVFGDPDHPAVNDTDLRNAFNYDSDDAYPRERAFMSRFSLNNFVYSANNSANESIVFIDSGTQRSIFCDVDMLCNLRSCSLQAVNGISGKCETTIMGDYWLHAPHAGNANYRVLIKDCLLVPACGVNLLSTRQLQKANITVTFPGDDTGKPTCIKFTTRTGNKVKIPLPRFGDLFTVPAPPKAIRSYIGRLQHLTAEELWHHRLAHVPIDKLIAASKTSDGFSAHLSRRGWRCKCLTCMDSNIIKNDSAGPSTTTNTGGVSVDLVDMGTALSIGGSRYMTIFCTLDTRFVRIFVHKSKADFPTILLRALAQMRSTPTFLRSDGAGEYFTPAVEEILLSKGIDRQNSNAHEQQGNGRSETLVRSIGKGIRAQLHSSNLPMEFWALAAANWVDIINRLPHDGLDGASPWTLEKGTRPDFSMFKPFGCRATVFLGKARAEHHKLSARGEACVCVGTGLAGGEKGWLVYSMKLRRLFCTKNALFDELWMPMRLTDQRIRGFGDPSTRTDMIVDAVGTVENAARIPGDIDASLTQPFEPCERHATTDTNVNDNAPFPVHAPETPDADFLDVLDLDQPSLADSPQPSQASPVSPSSPATHAGGGSSTASGGAAAISGGPTPRSGGDATRDDSSNHSTNSTGTRLSGTASDASSNLAPPLPASAGDLAGQASRRTAAEAIARLGDRPISQATDLELSMWCEEHALDVEFTKDHWPRERSNGPWTGQAVGTDTSTGSLPRTVFSFQKPKPHTVAVNISTGAHNLRSAIAHTFPRAVKLSDLTPRPRAQCAQQPPRNTPQRAETRGQAARARSVFTAAVKTLAALALHDSRQGQLQQLCDARTYNINNQSHGASLLAYIATAQVCGVARKQRGSDCQHNLCAFEDPEPRNARAARLRKDWPLWEKAEETEFNTLLKFGCFEFVDRPENLDAIPLHYVYKLKIQDAQYDKPRYKARLVMDGSLQYESEYTITYSPTARLFSLRTLCAIAAQEGLTLHKWDITAAFISSLIDVPQYVSIPGVEPPPGKAILLKRALYGGKSSGALYHRDINAFLLDYGFTANSADPTLYRLQKEDSVILLSLYVDDGACATNDQFLYKEFLDALSAKYDLSDKGILDWHLGMRVEQDLVAGTVTLSQSAYIDSVLERFGMTDCNTASTPMIPHTYLSKLDCPEKPDPKTVKYFQQLIGSLQYLSCATRCDISHAVNSCSQFLASPGPTHIEAAKHVLRYLKGTKDVGVSYGKAPVGSENELYGYVDADHAGDKDDRKSVGGYVMMLNGGPISWSSKKIKITSLSSFESEWYSASLAGCEVEALRRLLDDLGYAQKSATVLFEDNAACIYASDPDRPMSSRSKHIDTRVYRLRDLVRDKVLKLVKIDTSQQLADGFTKALPAPAVAAFRRVMCSAL